MVHKLKSMKKTDLVRDVKDFIKRVQEFDKEQEALAFFGDEISYDLNTPEKMNREELEYVIKNADKILTTKEILWDFKGN